LQRSLDPLAIFKGLRGLLLREGRGKGRGRERGEREGEGKGREGCPPIGESGSASVFLKIFSGLDRLMKI